MSLNQQAADTFRNIADLMDIKGENAFKVLAYRKVARIIESLPDDLRGMVQQNTVCEIEGVGEHSRRIIEELARDGRSTDYDQIAASVPAGLVPLLQVEGIGPKTIGLLWRQRGITSAEQLAKAIGDGSLKGIKGIGDKKIEAWRKGLEARAKAGGRIGLVDALPIADEFVTEVRALSGVVAAQYAGSLRRRRETIGDIDLLASVDDPARCAAVAEAFCKLTGVERILGSGPTKASIVSRAGVQVDLRVLSSEHYGAALLYFTGSKDHNIKIRALAQKKKLTLNEWGLYDQDEYEKAGKKTSEAPAAKPLASRTEDEIYAKLGLRFIEPELREDRGEVEAALEDRLPRLIAHDDLRGDLHTHTTASDGMNSIEEMAQAALDLGYEYLAITDHSKSQVIANGLSPERLLKHAAAIRRANEHLKGITLLAGAEVDILADGHLDYEDAVLAELDIVIASPHTALKQDGPKATDRLLRAIEHKYVNIVGHPSGRLIGGREGLSPDWARLYKAAADCGCALEINAGWPRLDLNDIQSRAAAGTGVMLAINTDAHAAQGLADIGLGLDVARRAWLTPAHIVNCLPLAALRRFLQRKR